MAENKNLILNNPFGFNVALPKKSIQEVQKVAAQELENITVNPFLDYLNDNDKVFSGEVANEIGKYQAQMYALGQTMREGQPKRTFNVKV